MRGAAGALIVAALLALLAIFLPARLPPAGLATEIEHRAKSGAGRAPVVILLGGSEGGMPPRTHPIMGALQNAGFSLARVAYFGAPGTPRHLDRIALDPFADLIGDLEADPRVDGRCIFVLGASKGAELALLLASGDVRLTAVAAVAPPHVVFQSSRISLAQRSSWRRGDRPLAFVPYPRANLDTIRGVLGVQGYRAMHSAALNADIPPGAILPVERITAPVLLAYGTRDQVWPADLMAEQIIARMEQNPPQVYADGGDHYVMDRGNARAAITQFLTQVAQSRGCLPAQRL